MEKFIKSVLAVFFVIATFNSCEEYLDLPPEADITPDDVFSTYQNYQGFIDRLYDYVLDYNGMSICVGQNLTGETIARQGWNTAQAASTGNYLNLVGGRSNFKFFGNNNGIWKNGWEGIRRSNIALENLDLLVNAEQNEKDIIEGQAYFFRAFLHWEILRAYGSIPYINSVLAADGDLQLPRFYEYNGKFDYQAATEYIVEDLDKAAALLPIEWGASSDNGRITKGAALAIKAKALLYAGSPLMNENSRNSATFDAGYMARAAEAAAEVLKLADQGVYMLEPFESYKSIFATNEAGLKPFSRETILQRNKNAKGNSQVNVFIGRLYLPHQGRFGGNAITEAVTQNFVDIFEMADGTKYDISYDTQDDKRWNGRDPRFRANIYVDGDRAGIGNNTVLQLYNGGATLNNGNTLSPYIVHKYWPIGANRADKVWNEFRFNTPQIRLAEMYLIYAEAVYQSTNSANATSSNYGMTALDAINTVRARAGHALVVNLSNYNNDFQELVRYERDIELCFEGHRWYDMRRWKIKPDPILYRMTFDRDYTFFNREEIQPYIFTDRNYWMPLPRDLTFAYEGFPQNPGWE